MLIHYGYTAAKQLISLDTSTQRRIADKMKFFARQENPVLFAKYIRTQKTYRFRIGDYRIFFDIKESMICVNEISRRDKAYN